MKHMVGDEAIPDQEHAGADDVFRVAWLLALVSFPWSLALGMFKHDRGGPYLMMAS